MNKVTKFYTSILQAAGLSVDSDGVVIMSIGDEDFPATIDDKTLVLPIKSILKAGQWEDIVAFHPISENILRGESDVLKKFRTLLTLRLKTILAQLIIELTEYAANGDHSKLSPIQSTVLSKLTTADDKMVTCFEKILRSASIDGPNKLVSMYLKRGGTYEGEKYNRVCVTTLPITEVDTSVEREIFGVKCRIKDVDSLMGLIEYLTGGIDFTRGSNAKTAPYLHSMMLSYSIIAEQLNEMVERFTSVLNDPDSLTINMDWVTALGSLPAMRDIIPPLDGNSGGIDKAEAAAPAALPQPVNPYLAPAYAPAQPLAPVPTAPPQPAPLTKSASGTVSWNDVVNASASLRQQALLPAPVYQQQPRTRGAPYQQMQPQYIQPQYASQPQLLHYGAAPQPLYQQPPQQYPGYQHGTF